LTHRLLGQTATMLRPIVDGSADLLWANMSLHTEPDPAACVKAWHRLLAVDGMLMFSCLGPDTAMELRPIYAANGWGPSAHPLTDMHDWGDLLVGSGFSEPVMDMERVVLSFATAKRALQELRGLGRNLHPERFSGLRGRIWHKRLLAALEERAGSAGEITLTFEVIYGHAIKQAPRVPVSSESAIALDDVRAMLRQQRPPLRP
jgi:malonyl-CoA O-methyltransferase